MSRYKIVLSYDGTAYAGWQIQPNAPTVQAHIEQALLRLTRETVRIHGSGRTDQGVHARRQVLHVDLATPCAVRTLREGLNALLPHDIRIYRAVRVGPTFHARRSARSKEYRYFIHNAPVMPPVKRHYRTHVRDPLDTHAMTEAANLMIGCRDFAAFTANSKKVLESTVRDLTHLRVDKRGAEVTIVARANGFLYKMVRSIAGFLVRVGEGGASPSETSEILASRRRTARVPTAPPQGLFLWNVWY